jgi:aminodeoxyfutalosine deaminase
MTSPTRCETLASVLCVVNYLRRILRLPLVSGLICCSLYTRSMPSVLYTADVVCPMSGPPVARGGVLVEGDRVVEVGAASDLAPRATRVHEIRGVLLPALVNGHTALEYTDAYTLAVPGPAHAWVRALDGITRSWSDEAWSRSAHRGIQEALRAGSTTLGDVVRRGPAVPGAVRAGLAGDSWVQVTMVDVEHADSVMGQVEHALGLPAQGRRVGVAPHAPSLLGTGVLQGLASLAQRAGVSLHIEAAETQVEVAAIRSGDGPLAAYAREHAFEFEWLDGGTGLSPIRYLDACGALSPLTSVVHGVYVDVLESRLLAERGATVVCCPRANTLRSAGDAPLERYADAGVRMALGTGATAAVPDLDLLAEAAAWVALARRRDLMFWPSSVGPITLEEQAIRLATVDGARAMGWGGHAGVLEPGRRADLVGVEIATRPESAYRDLVEHGPGRQVLTVLAGVRRSRRASADEPWPEIDRRELNA